MDLQTIIETLLKNIFPYVPLLIYSVSGLKCFF